MKCIILDGFWIADPQNAATRLEALGLSVQHFNRTSQDELYQRAADADILIDNKVVLGEEQFQRLPNLKYIGVAATGYNIIDCQAARNHNIVVTNVPAYSTDSVAQTVFAYILDACQKVALHSEAVHDGAWAASPYFSFWRTPLHELAGHTIGIVGLGRIGLKVAEIAHAFGMTVLGTSRTVKDNLPAYIQQVPLDTLLSQSDFITLHCPLTDQSRHLINADSIARMKPTAYLINTSRGPVVDEAALAQALNNGRLAGAAVDVLSVEPPTADNPLIGAPNAIVTPHYAWATLEARERLFTVIIDNIRAFLAHQSLNVVNYSKRQ